MHFPDSILQILIVESSELVARSFTTGENATPMTNLEWPFKVCNTLPVWKFHIFAVLSQDPEAIY